MKIVLLVIGRTSERYLLDGLSNYQKRLQHYIQFEIFEIPNIKKAKNFSKIELIKKEGALIINKIQPYDYVILLDNKGQEYTSLRFSDKLQSWQLSGKKRLVFVIGGAYGFSDDLHLLANESLSLSKMTFSHQIVRLFFLEQLYRGYTILNNEPYHHE